MTDHCETDKRDSYSLIESLGKSPQRVSRRGFFASLALCAIGSQGCFEKKSSIKPADLSQYPPMPWGDDIYFSMEDIRDASLDDFIKVFSTPAAAVGFVRLVDVYNSEVSNGISDELQRTPIDKRTVLGENTPLAAINIYSDLLGRRDKTDVWYEELRGFAAYRCLTDEFLIASDDTLSLFPITDLHDSKQMILRSDLDEELSHDDFRLYCGLIMRSDMPDDEKIANIKTPLEERHIFPYAYSFPRLKGMSYDEQSKKTSALSAYYDSYSPSHSGRLGVCEDIALVIMDLLIDDGYPALGLCMGNDDKHDNSGHIVYLVKGKEGYGYIGYNPGLHFSKPKFATVKSLMRKDFPNFDRCIVLDFEKLGIIGEKPGNGEYRSNTWTHKYMIPVNRYEG